MGRQPISLATNSIWDQTRCTRSPYSSSSTKTSGGGEDWAMARQKVTQALSDSVSARAIVCVQKKAMETAERNHRKRKTIANLLTRKMAVKQIVVEKASECLLPFFLFSLFSDLLYDYESKYLLPLYIA